MNQVTIDQFYLFMIFILNGVMIGILFDIFRILRRSFNTSNIITCIEDAIFWTLSAFSILYTLFVFNNGEIRGYIFIGLFLGIALYMLFLSKPIIKISVKIILFFKNIICKILKIILYPIKIIIKYINKIISIPAKFISKHWHNMTNSVKKNISKKYIHRTSTQHKTR